MSLASSQGCINYLTGIISELQYKMQNIMGIQQGYAMRAANLGQELSLAVSGSRTPGSPPPRPSRAIEADMEYVHAEDKKWELLAKQLETQIKSAEQRLKAAEKAQDRNIKQGFKAYT